MKTDSLVAVALAAVALTLCGSTARGEGFEAGTLLWYADNGQNEALLWGPLLQFVPATNGLPFEACASLIHGKFNQGGDREDVREWLVMAGWVSPLGVLSAGWTYHGIKTDLQRGFVWSYPEEGTERNADLHGPYLAYELTWPPEGPVSATLSAGLMPHDFGDLDDLGYDASFYDLAGGLQWVATRVRAEAGYRYRAYRDLPDRVINETAYERSTQEGLYFSLLFRF